MILITTSRKPSRRTRSFCKDLQYSIKNSIYLTRGKTSLEELLEMLDEKDRLLHVSEIKANPSRIIIMDRDGYVYIIIYISGIKLIRENKNFKYEGIKDELIQYMERILNEKLDAVVNNNRILFRTGLEIRIRKIDRTKRYMQEILQLEKKRIFRDNYENSGVDKKL